MLASDGRQRYKIHKSSKKYNGKKIIHIGDNCTLIAFDLQEGLLKILYVIIDYLYTVFRYLSHLYLTYDDSIIGDVLFIDDYSE